jgi:hypothetical protein
MPRPYDANLIQRAKRGVILAVALIAGVFAALRPFANVTDPAIETLDKVICPFYLLAPVFNEIPGLRDGPFFITAITVNALLYAAAAWKITAIWVVRSRK